MWKNILLKHEKLPQMDSENIQRLKPCLDYLNLWYNSKKNKDYRQYIHTKIEFAPIESSYKIQNMDRQIKL